MFHMLTYRRTTLVTDVFADMTAIADPIISTRSGHYIFSEPYVVLAAAQLGVTQTDVRWNVPSINAISRHHIFPLGLAAVPGSYPRIADYRNNPIPIPQNEEFAVEVTDAVAEEVTHHLWIAPSGWNRNLPAASPSNPRILLAFTASVARTALTWSGPGAITFEQTPRGGWYCVNACYVQVAAVRAFRLFFPRAQQYNGRILRPGMFANNASGNLITPYFADGLGEWGRFHTFEPPQLEVYGDAAGASTEIGFLDVTYLGDKPVY